MNIIIDFHQHFALGGEKDFLRRLLEGMDEAGVDIVCLNGVVVPPTQAVNGNAEVENAFRKYPGRIIGFGAVYPGRDSFQKVDELHSRGFKGLKMIWPTNRYDHEDFGPYYQKAEDYDMPILFHTGIVAASPIDKEWKISSSYMQPVCLDKICRMFPKLKVIGAHMGDPWFLEAYMTSQKNPNMWLDISGLAIFVKAANIRRYLNIRLTSNKLLWGLDEPPEKYLRLLLTWKTLVREIGISEEDSESIFGKTAGTILGIK